MRELHQILTDFETYTSSEETEKLSKSLNKLENYISCSPYQLGLRDCHFIAESLRRKRHFEELEQIVTLMNHAGHQSPMLTRLCAQSLIELKAFDKATRLLSLLLADDKTPNKEKQEAQGLRGRIFKQLYVDSVANGHPHHKHLVEAIDAYFLGYDSYKNSWHGVNFIALVKRAQKDGVELDKDYGEDLLLELLIKSLLEKSSDGCIVLWDYATLAELYLAKTDYSKALSWITKYVEDEMVETYQADCFEYASTLRQFEEVWCLNGVSDEADSIIQLLRARILSLRNGAITISPKSVQQNLGSSINLEKVFGTEYYKDITWYRNGLEKAACVGKVIYARSLKPIGTGFIVQGHLLSEYWKNELVFVTNAHVVSNLESELQHSDSPALSLENTKVKFEIIEGSTTYLFKEILYSSSRDEFDCTILKLEKELPIGDIQPIRYIEKNLPRPGGTERVYIIGHPTGNPLSFSLQDNTLLDHDKTKLHYRTPTQGGSSGSPVFNEEWDLIALHHGGHEQLDRLNSQGGTYSANEGISISKIKQAIQKSFPNIAN